MSQATEEQPTPERFIAFIEAQHPTNTISHSSWCGCAVGDYLTEETGEKVTETYAREFIKTLNFSDEPHWQDLWAALNYDRYYHKLECYNDLQVFIKNDFQLKDI